MAFPTTGIVDNFNRADTGPPPSGNWGSAISGTGAALKVVSNACVANANGASGWWSASTFGPDSECYVTWTTAVSTLRVYLRVQNPGTSSLNGYFVNQSTSLQVVQMFRIDNNVNTQLGGDSATIVPADGDKLGVDMVGSTLTAYYNNTGSWSTVDSFSPDTTYSTAGNIGLLVSNISAASDDFGGGTISAGGNVTVTGVRAQAYATGRPGTVQINNPVVTALPMQTWMPPQLSSQPITPRFAQLQPTGVEQNAIGYQQPLPISQFVNPLTLALGLRGILPSPQPYYPTVQIDQTVAGVRAAAAATGRAGSIRVDAGGARAPAAATGRAGLVEVDDTVTGVRAAAAATGRAGSPSILIGGVRAAAAASGRAGAPSILVTGSRAPAVASGRAGSVSITIPGSRAVAVASGRAGAVQVGNNVIVVGARAAATATGRAGTVRLDQNVIGVRAAAAATGRAGAPRLLIGGGARAAAAATGRAGTVSLNPAVVGARAAAAATGRAGTVRLDQTVTGVRAQAYATGRPGQVVLSGQTLTVIGVRAAAGATGRAGSPQILLSGARSASAATGRTQGPLLSPSRSRAPAVASGRAGTTVISSAVVGVRAQAYAGARAGVPTSATNITVAGVRARSYAAGRAGTIRLDNAVIGVRSAAATFTRHGSIRLDSTVLAPRAQARAFCRPGIGGAGSTPVLTWRTISPSPNGRTLVLTTSGRTTNNVTGGRTRART